VPVEVTDKLNDFRRVMRGTSGENPRCIALQGIIGIGVHCAIYEHRASVCRDFPASFHNGEPNERCDQARAAWGLAPLLPDSQPDDFPKAA
jgi:Fe-S-cluster containining protein